MGTIDVTSDARPNVTMSMSDAADRLCINTIRTGTPMALAPVVYCLWQRVLRYDPQPSDLAQP
jgi:transketolase